MTDIPPDQPKQGFFSRHASKFATTTILGVPVAVVTGAAYLVSQAPEPSKPVDPVVIVQPPPPPPPPVKDVTVLPKTDQLPLPPEKPAPDPVLEAVFLELDRIRVEIEGLQSQVDDLERNRTTTLRQIEQLKAEIARKRVTIVQSNGREKGLKQQIAALRQQLNRLKNRVVTHNLADDPSAPFKGRNGR